jgi:hypothetical protein
MHDDNIGHHGTSPDLENLLRERDRLRAKLDACRHDLDQARLELAQAREIQESLTEQLHARAAAGDEVASKLRNDRRAEQSVGWWRKMRMSSEQRAMLEDVELVRASKWFDAEWYVAEYPDVANAGIDPAEHYLRHGAPERRDPGPLFNTDAYLRDHPEVVDSGINPLLHFLRSRSGQDDSV